jgi:hypothetical protein
MDYKKIYLLVDEQSSASAESRAKYFLIDMKELNQIKGFNHKSIIVEPLSAFMHDIVDKRNDNRAEAKKLFERLSELREWNSDIELQSEIAVKFSRMVMDLFVGGITDVYDIDHGTHNVEEAFRLLDKYKLVVVEVA